MTAYEMRISDWSSDVCSSDLEGASAIKSKLLRLKDAERIFCPLAAPNIWELRKQAGASLYRTAELMEELSEHVVFRQVDQLASYEVDAFLAYLLGNPIKPLGINEKFAPLLGYLAPAYELSGTEAVAPHITHQLGRASGWDSVCQYVYISVVAGS